MSPLFLKLFLIFSYSLCRFILFRRCLFYFYVFILYMISFIFSSYECWVSYLSEIVCFFFAYYNPCTCFSSLIFVSTFRHFLLFLLSLVIFSLVCFSFYVFFVLIMVRSSLNSWTNHFILFYIFPLSINLSLFLYNFLILFNYSNNFFLFHCFFIFLFIFVVFTSPSFLLPSIFLTSFRQQLQNYFRIPVSRRLLFNIWNVYGFSISFIWLVAFIFYSISFSLDFFPSKLFSFRSSFAFVSIISCLVVFFLFIFKKKVGSHVWLACYNVSRNIFHLVCFCFYES